MNDLDSQRLAGQLTLRGWAPATGPAEADLVLLNTCSIRDKSEQKVYHYLGRLRSLKSERPLKIGVAGCVAQQEAGRILDRAPWVDFVMGPGTVGLLDEVLDGERRIATEFPADRRYDWLSIDRPSKVRAQVTVVEGCNKNCTYCIVPTTRGREVSRSLRSIVAETSHAVSTGRSEIELLGQTVNAWRCPESDAGFGDLLDAVAGVPGVRRVRFMTSHPAEVDDSMIAAMAGNENVSKFLHLPVQSGSSRILRRMKRLYTPERYLEIVGRIRGAMPQIRFSTDVIVGFPGETEDDFRQTLELLEEVRFGSLFAFVYSERPGTPALRLGDKVDEGVARERLNRLFAFQERIQSEVLDGYVGKTVDVLVEGPSRASELELAGRTDDNLTVNFTGGADNCVGALVPVKIIEARHHTLKGEAA
ncbi:MAG: tRNA (N6-isopentenyl adenosine(37)-C2)-methylthiotransferase MiaB [Acidobacteria bacterium]|nr:tRNA (N6-isopentenyl adenosine(37)-C2)-methylthiotransferase MiaB [Acidobacteriota bacterium]